MKYYWLKLDKNFFQQHDVRMIESLPDGKEMLLFYIKLLAESVSHEGDLRFSDDVAYDNGMLAGITSTDITIVDKAMALFTKLKLVEVKEDETITMNEVKSLIGKDDSAAMSNRERQARFRERHSNDKVTQETVTKPLRTVTSNAYSNEVETVLNYFNEKCGTHYRSDANKKVIKARLEEKFTVDDCKKVIDKKHKSWAKDEKMVAYLRPETLFAKSHFESYLNEQEARPKSSKFSDIDTHNYDFNELERILT